jgi:6,7-dimethyl-8-ribityllumazine synthase
MSAIQNSSPDTIKKTGQKIVLIVSRYHRQITDRLQASAIKTLTEAGIEHDNIVIHTVPGAFELPFVCKQAIEKYSPHAVIALGCIIKGETDHFNFIAQACANGIMEIGLKYDLPVIFGVLTPNNIEQARDRIAGGKQGNKGAEAAQTAINLLNTLSCKN